MHLASVSGLTVYQMHRLGDQKGKEVMVPSPDLGYRVQDVPDRPVSLLQDGVCSLHMNGPRNMREIERLAWSTAASVTLQFKFLNIFFAFFGHKRDRFHSRVCH